MPSGPDTFDREPDPAPMRLVRRLSPPRPGDVLITADVGPAGEAVSLWGPAELEDQIYSYIEYPNGVRAPASQVAPWSARIVVASPDKPQTVTEVKGLTIAMPRLQTLPGGRLLLAGARCRINGGEAEHNAAIIDSDGAVIRTGTIGDGIAGVQTTPSGRIVVAYFDEGVFGNNGWGGPSGPEPIGAPGLVAFDLDLQPVWSYDASAPEAPGIAECYALNVTGEDVWISVYPGFALVRIDERGVTVWPNEIAAGARGLLVNGDTAGWIGGYGASPHLLTTGALIDTGTVPQSVCHIGSDGTTGPAEFAASVARGPRLHRFTATGDWFVLDLEDVSA